MPKHHSQLYKTPRVPGYLGAYNWRASGVGLVFLCLVSLVATQYIAARFRYQEALGQPLLRTRRAKLYQPFAWVLWGWRYSTSRDAGIKRPLFEGEMVVVAGSFLSVA